MLQPRRRIEYSRYRGARARRVGIMLFILLVVLAAGALVFLLFGNIELTEDGPVLTFGFASDEPVESPDLPKNPSLVIIDPSPKPAEPTPSPTATPEPTPDPAAERPESIRAVYLPDITDSGAVEGALALARNGYIDTVVLELKHDNGSLEFSSALSLAEAAGALPEENIAADVIRHFKAEGVYVIAQMYAFEDSLASNSARELTMATADGVRWLDHQYHGWLDPYKDGSREYITALALETVELGADEVLLDRFCFPTRGKPQLLYFEQEEILSREQLLADYAAELSAALAEKGAVLALRVSADWLDTPAEGSGFDAALAAEAGAYIFVESTQPLEGAPCGFSCVLAYEYTDPNAGAAAAALDKLAGGNDLVIVSGDGYYPSVWQQ